MSNLRRIVLLLALLGATVILGYRSMEHLAWYTGSAVYRGDLAIREEVEVLQAQGLLPPDVSDEAIHRLGWETAMIALKGLGPVDLSFALFALCLTGLVLAAWPRRRSAPPQHKAASGAS